MGRTGERRGLFPGGLQFSLNESTREMGRKNATLRLEDDVDEWLDKFTSNRDATRSDVSNRAIKVYAAKMASGEWKDPRYQDRFDEMFEEL